MKPLSIAMLTSFYFPHIGGTEQYVHDLSEALVRRGHRVTVFTHYPGKNTGGDGDGLEVRRVPAFWLPYRPLFSAFPAALLETFDVLHSHAPSFVFTRRASGLGVPHIVTYHCDFEFPDQAGKFRIPGPVKKYFDRHFQERAAAHLGKVDRIVATDLPGVKDVVASSGGGRLVPARDPGALAEAILDLLSRPKERKSMGDSGRNWVLRNHRWDDIAGRFEKIYGELIR